MRKFPLAIVFGAFILTLGDAQEVVPFSLGNAGHIVISARVNDTTGTFILDTGAGIHVVTPRMLKRLRPQPTSAGLFTGFRHNGERLDAELFQAQSLSVGGQVQAAPVLGIYPPLEQWGIDGLISMKFFEDRPLTIDFLRKEIRFESSRELERIARTSETIPLAFHADRGVMLDLFVRLVLQDSVELQAEFDTGSGFETILVHPHFLGRLGIDTASARKEIIVKSIQYAGAPSTRISNANVTFKEGLIYEGLIGSGAFRGKRLTIDIPNRRMMVW